MLKIIKRREQVTVTSYVRAYDYVGETNCGFAFDCNKAGVVNVEALRPASKANYEACLTGQVGTRKVVDCGVQKREHSYTEPTVGRCPCGRHVELANFTNTCDCGRDYNMSGQELAPRAQWGEETGEHYTDLLRM